MNISVIKDFHKGLFLYKFFTKPKQVGSITPSSKFLTKKMFEAVDWNNIDTIIELGAGTGVFTEYINQNIKPNTTFIVIEKDDEMRNILKKKYPHFHFKPDAESIRSVLSGLSKNKADLIVSGLPFANFSLDVRETILSEIDSSLNIGGQFIAFQYSLQMKNMLMSKFHIKKIGYTLLNIPPAFVYFCKKKEK